MINLIYKTESSTQEVSEYLKIVPYNTQLGDDAIEVQIKRDEFHNRYSNNKKFEFLGIGTGEVKIDEETTSDKKELLIKTFEALNKKFTMLYSCKSSCFDEDYFTKEQLQRLTDHGKLLSGLGTVRYIELQHLLKEEKKSFSSQLKDVVAAGEDKEWYPTTNEIIEAVFFNTLNKNYWYDPDKENSEKYDFTSKSFLDIGCGNGKFFEVMQDLAIANKQNNKEVFQFQNTFAIEQSQTLISKLDKSVFVVGTDYFESTLIDKPVDVIFTNPPFSVYEQWSIKTIKEANANEIYLVIPKRWSDNKLIAAAIESRDASAEIIGSYSFSDAEDRKARAEVDLVKVILKDKDSKDNDPFKLWFNETFKINMDEKTNHKYSSDYEKKEQAKSKLKELVSGKNLVETLCVLYNKEMEHLMQNYLSIASLDGELLEEIGVSIEGLQESLKLKITGTKNKYWQELFDNMEMITKRLTKSSRGSLLGTLTSNTNVDFTVSNAHSIVVWAVKNANMYYDSQLLKLYKSLSKQENVQLYKSNDKWTDDMWRYNRNAEKLSHYSLLEYRIVDHHYDAISTRYDAVDGMGPIARTQIEDIFVIAKNLGFNITSRLADKYFTAGQKELFYMNENGDHEIFAEIKAFKNGNLHYKFSKKFMKAFNIEAARLNMWIKSPKEACEEFDIELEEAELYFNTNYELTPQSCSSLLPAPIKEDKEIAKKIISDKAVNNIEEVDEVNEAFQNGTLF